MPPAVPSGVHARRRQHPCRLQTAYIGLCSLASVSGLVGVRVDGKQPRGRSHAASDAMQPIPSRFEHGCDGVSVEAGVVEAVFRQRALVIASREHRHASLSPLNSGFDQSLVCDELGHGYASRAILRSATAK